MGVIDYSDFIWGDRFKEAFPNYYCKIDDPAHQPMFTRVLSHNSDLPIDDSVLDTFPSVSVWIGQNICTGDSRCYPIPIGLENDYIGGQPGRKQLLAFTARRCETRHAGGLCYYNCRNTNPEREEARRWFFDKLWCTFSEAKDYVAYLEDMARHAFVVCPRGNGLDCHRTWEALYLGRYPIMRREWSLERLYCDLPVLFVDEWSDVTEDLLIRVCDEFAAISWNLDKLKFSWWRGYVEGLFA
jgi:hypothetical protein